MRSGNPRTLRTLNEAAVLNALFEHGPLTRPQIEDITGISKPAAARLLLRVEEAGVVERAGERASKHGPAAVVWQIKDRARLVAGVVVSRDELTIEVTDLLAEVIGTATVAHDVTRADQIAPLITSLLTLALQDTGHEIAEVGDLTIGLPGIVDPARGVLKASQAAAAWVGVELIELIESWLPEATVSVANDVSLVLISEHEFGAARGHDSVALLWSGLGLKVAFLHQGHLMAGPHGMAGEVSTAVGPNWSGQPSGLPGEGEQLGTALSPPELARLGDQIQPLADRLAVVLSPVLGLLDPELVLLSGPIAEEHGTALVEPVRQALSFMPNRVPPITPGELGPRAMVRGAVCLSLRRARAYLLSRGSQSDFELAEA